MTARMRRKKTELQCEEVRMILLTDVMYKKGSKPVFLSSKRGKRPSSVSLTRIVYL